MRSVLVAILLILVLATDGLAATTLVARVDISDQRMNVYQNGKLVYRWKVSTGKKGFATPTGAYGPKRLHAMWYSSKYGNAPMPHSIFFRGGYAIHGTTEVKRLGRPASHGCVRLHPDHARALFSMVKAAGAKRTKIIVQW